MDAVIRELLRLWESDPADEQLCLKIDNYYRRMGELPPVEILYCSTPLRIQEQEKIDFRDLLQKASDKLSEGTRSGFGAYRYQDYRVLPGFSFGFGDMQPLNLSVQASSGHYCGPRKTLEDLKKYTNWEVYFEAPSERKTFYAPEEQREEIATYQAEHPTAKLLDGDSDTMTFEEINPHYLPGGLLYLMPQQEMWSRNDPGIAAYAPTVGVQEVFDFLRARFGLTSR